MSLRVRYYICIRRSTFRHLRQATADNTFFAEYFFVFLLSAEYLLPQSCPWVHFV